MKRPAIPSTNAGTHSAHPIDAFIAHALEVKGLRMNGEASPRELIRRAYFGLIGLPPSPEEVAAFESDPSETAWMKLIDNLLARPQYGERWGRHWLDQVRYAESNGYERDGPKPNVWRYRDYIIQSFNQDKPYDRFIKEQLAGDELYEEDAISASSEKEAWRQAIIATGYYRLHVWDDEPDSTVAAEYDDFDDIMVTTGSSFLGMTIGCARCHDHKFDPISQKDYYSMLSFFRSIDPYGEHKTGGGSRGTGKIERPLATHGEMEAWEKEKATRVKALKHQLDQSTEEANRKSLEAQLKKIEEEQMPFEKALAAVENGSKPVATFILARGDPNSPTSEADPQFPSVFGEVKPVINSNGKHSTGRRRVLAEWIADPGHPLTARVMVNQLWQRHFGVGIVPTADDFGLAGVPPTNQPLLDYLAAEFVSNGWSIKQMHRFIMTSKTYRMSSKSNNKFANERDEANQYLWRQNLRRVEAEVIRDTILAVSGTLNAKQGGPSVYPTLPQEVHTTQDAAGKGWHDSPPEEQNRRSVYLVVKRALREPLLESFDAASSASPSGTRNITTTAPQALSLLNDPFVQKQASAFAERLSREAPESLESKIKHAFALVTQRLPSPQEIGLAGKLMVEQEELARKEGKSKPAEVALQSFCRAMLNLNEMIYID
ncbi:MAG: DUF1549 and DUF1553 domain-containing protein [Verrucomicrobiales bacterium]